MQWVVSLLTICISHKTKHSQVFVIFSPQRRTNVAFSFLFEAVTICFDLLTLVKMRDEERIRKQHAAIYFI